MEFDFSPEVNIAQKIWCDTYKNVYLSIYNQMFDHYVESSGMEAPIKAHEAAEEWARDSADDELELYMGGHIDEDGNPYE